MGNLNLENLKSDFIQNGYVVMKDFFSAQEKDELVHMVDDLSTWPKAPGQWMKYYEGTNRGSMLCRMENFLPYHDKLKSIFDGDLIHTVLHGLMGEKAVLFKEKINFKLPGGGSFLPHQDAPAFLTFNQKFHITAMVAIDDATEENGCLKFAHPVEEGHMLEQADDGTIAPHVYRNFQWKNLEANKGDIVFFDSYVPHYSEINRSQKSRRAIFVTYNRLSEGCKRDEYYQHKRENFPPDYERIQGKDYSQGARMYNLGNPIQVNG